eukprot:GFUD01014053.1.p1 GENE.GFUD01014053.1~~GFUD01014053.1.p1  ORF type:complete len:339 (+),score=79.24 GFUD01014053.1:46-1017(+)
MGTEKFCLRWNDFESNISSAFRDLRDDKEFFDLTLACDDEEQIQAHKVILAACSPFFRNVLRRNPHQHPLLYLKGVKYTDLQSVLSFMYHGEVNVAQEELNSFLAVAEELKIKGLTQNNSKESHPKKDKPPLPKIRPTSPKYTNSTTHTKPANLNQADDEIQEIVPVKSEPREQPLTPVTPVPKIVPAHKEIFSPQISQAVAPVDDQVWDSQENYEDYNQYETGMDQGYDQSAGSNTAWNMEHEGVDQQIECLIQKNLDGGYLCTACGYSNSVKKDLKRHVETHIDTPGYPCNFCYKQFKTRNSLNTHLSIKHREERKQYNVQ